MSLRWRIALALAAIAAATTLAVGWASYQATSERLEEAVDAGLLQALDTWARDESALSAGGPFDVYFVQWVRPDGTVWPSPGRDPVGPGSGPEEVRETRARLSYDTVGSDDGDVRLLSAEGPRPFVVQVGRSLTESDEVLADLRTRTILLVVFVTLAAAALGWLIATTVTGPLVRLTRAATDVERSGRLDVQVPVAGNDEVGRLGEAFNGMLGALATSRDDQRRLVEDAGHELRTPLTSVRTNLAVLRRHPDLDPPTRSKVLDDLHVETEELVGLVEEVVALARGVTDGAPVERIELGELARSVAARAERRHGRAVTVTADDSLVDAPPSDVERAISNLVDNAAKFDTSGQPIEIAVAAGAAGRARPRSRYRRRRSGAGVRPLLPLRSGAGAARIGARPVDRARGRRAPRRHRRSVGSPRRRGERRLHAPDSGRLRTAIQIGPMRRPG